MNWQRFEGQQAEMQGIGQQHFLACSMTREQQELARRKAEHMEAIEHIAPQQGYISPVFRQSRLTEKALREHFHLPLLEVAKKFGMCTTAFKKLCRKQGVMHWPQRTLKSLEKKIASLHAEQKFTSDQNHIEEQIRKLESKREMILAGNGLSNMEPDPEMQGTSPSDDSTNSASGGSSPRASDVLSHLVLDDSSSTASSSSFQDEQRDRRRHSADDIKGKGSGRDTTAERNRKTQHDAAADEEADGAVTVGGTESEGMNFGDGGGGGGGGRRMRRVKTFGGLSTVQFHEHEGIGPHPSLNDLNAVAGGMPGAAGIRGDGFTQLPRKDPMDPWSTAVPFGAGPPGGGGYAGDPYGGDSGFRHSHALDAASMHMQALLGENKRLRSTIRALAQERDVWTRRALEAESELSTYRSHCHHLEHLLHSSGQSGQSSGMCTDPESTVRHESPGRGSGANEEIEPKMEPRDYRPYSLELDHNVNDLL